MPPLTKQKYFYYIALMLMASTFLPVVFNNLPPLIRSHHLWTFIWVISLLVFSPKILINKAMVYLLAYGLFLYLATETIWSNIDHWNYRRLFFEFYEIAIGVSVFTWFYQSKDFIHLAKIAKWSIIFLGITAIMSIISSAIDPLYARNITGLAAVADEKEIEAILSFKRYGGGTYSTAGAFMCLFPVCIYYYKNIKISLLSRVQIIVFSVIIFFALLGMQIFGNILIAVVFSIIALFGMRKLRQSILIIGIFFIIVFAIPKEVYVNSLLKVSNYFNKDSDLNYKFRDMSVYIETGADIKDNSTSTGGRVERYPMLMGTFVKSPMFGCYFFSDESGNGYKPEGAHLHWMNKLTTTGIIGLIVFLLIPYNFIRNNLRLFDPTYKFYYILASLSILSYGLIKQLGGRDTWYAFFIILPGLYYLPLLKIKNKVKDPGDMLSDLSKDESKKTIKNL
jgi:hypothetical protein